MALFEHNYEHKHKHLMVRVRAYCTRGKRESRIGQNTCTLSAQEGGDEGRAVGNRGGLPLYVSKLSKTMRNGGGGGLQRKAYFFLAVLLGASLLVGVVFYGGVQFALVDVSKATYYTRILDTMGPVQNSLCRLEAFGHEDGEKLMCINALSAKSGCWIMSIGSNGDFSFEGDIYRKTSCKVHIFDCTGDWQVPRDISSRVFFHKKCIGSRLHASSSGDHLPYEALVALAGPQPSQKQLIPPSYLKMDVEGYEFDVLPDMLASSHHLLPDQIAFELHIVTNINAGRAWAYNESARQYDLKSNALVESLFSKLKTANFSLVSRVDNPHCAHCSEVVVVASEALNNMK